jgi:hypothetical protein
VLTGATVLVVGAYLFVRTSRRKPGTRTGLARTCANGHCTHD